MSWEFAPEFDAAARAALNRGKSLVYVAPPAWWATLPLFAQFSGAQDHRLRTLVLAPERAAVVECAAHLRSLEHLRPVHAATGLSRTIRLLQAGSVASLIATPSDVLELLRRSSADLSAVDRLVIGWPEAHLALGLSETLDTILAECADAARVVLTADETPLTDFLARHARRAALVVASRRPEAASVSVRYAVTDLAGVAKTVRAACDILNPGSALIWDPQPRGIHDWAEFAAGPDIRVDADPGDQSVELAIAADLPSAEALSALRAVADELLVLARPSQLPYLHIIADRARPLRLPLEVDRARDRASRLRAEVRERIDEGVGAAELLALAPLFDEYDPATVAAVLAARPAQTEEPPSELAALPAWVRLHINSGRRDHIRTADVVGALLNAVGIAKDQIGRVDLRDGFSLIEVRAEVAAKALKGLNGLVLRGKKVAARIDHR